MASVEAKWEASVSNPTGRLVRVVAVGVEIA
jgi:hypothetical protein